MIDNQHQQIKGYRDLSQEEIDMMNECKQLAIEVHSIITALEQIESIDKRWLAIAKTDLQKGFMSLVRSIAKPTTFIFAMFLLSSCEVAIDLAGQIAGDVYRSSQLTSKKSPAPITPSVTAQK